MEKLFEYLGQIQNLLDQILTITDNQTTILLSLTGSEEEDEDQALDMMAQMADYKDEITKTLSSIEEDFQACYEASKGLIKEADHVRAVQGLVKAILDSKQAIVDQEQRNLLLLQAHSKKKIERVHVSHNASHVSDVYKKQQKKV